MQYKGIEYTARCQEGVGRNYTYEVQAPPLRIGDIVYPMFHASLRIPEWRIFTSIVRQFPGRVFFYDKDTPNISRFIQKTDFGPSILTVQSGRIINACMLEEYKHKHPFIPRTILPKEWYTSDGLWVNSEFEYLARELQ